MTGYISDIRFLLGKNPTVPSEYEMLSVDLNQNAGGEYIYLAFKTDADPANAISGLNVFADRKSSGWSIQPGYTLISQDLAQGAGGKYIYACYTKNTTNPPIRRVNVISGSSSLTFPVDATWVRIIQDCNEGAGGSFVYICYSYSETS